MVNFVWLLAIECFFSSYALILNVSQLMQSALIKSMATIREKETKASGSYNLGLFCAYLRHPFGVFSREIAPTRIYAIILISAINIHTPNKLSYVQVSRVNSVLGLFLHYHIIQKVNILSEKNIKMDFPFWYHLCITIKFIAVRVTYALGFVSISFSFISLCLGQWKVFTMWCCRKCHSNEYILVAFYVIRSFSINSMPLRNEEIWIWWHSFFTSSCFSMPNSHDNIVGWQNDVLEER